VRLVLSPQSLEDIEDIYAYSLSTWGAGQAELYRDRIFDALDLLMDLLRLVGSLPAILLPFECFASSSTTLFIELKMTPFAFFSWRMSAAIPCPN
jgi:plasmid stabilization system protein ParE